MNKIKLILISLLIIILIGGFWFYKKNNKLSTSFQYNIISNSGFTSSGISQSGIIDNIENTNVLAYINNFEGDVSKKTISDTENVKKGMTIINNDSIITGNSGSVEIIFADNSLVRLNSNTILTFNKLDSSNTEATLENGEIWARILKPITDSSFFTIKTSDLSAGVRGTSVLLKKSGSGTNVSVIDSYASNENERGIILQYVNPISKKLIKDKLKPQENLEFIPQENQISREKFKKSKAFLNNFILENTRKDIVYMDEIKDKIKDKKELLAKINGELGVSLPNKEEIKMFFKEDSVKEKTEFLFSLSSGGLVNPKSIIKNIKKDIEIQDLRNQIIEEKLKINKNNKSNKRNIEEIIKQKENLLNQTINDFKIQKDSQNDSNLIEQPLIDPKPTEPVITDIDKDSIPDSRDNCPKTPNKGQIDSDKDGIGDMCDPTPKPQIIDQKTTEPLLQDPKPTEPVITDIDKDSIPDSRDNCPKTPNKGQIDSDKDGIGDMCDPTPKPQIISGETLIK